MNTFPGRSIPRKSAGERDDQEVDDECQLLWRAKGNRGPNLLITMEIVPE